MRRLEPILIGPPTVGKTTVSKLLAERLGRPRVAMDDLLFSYFAEKGFSESHWKEIAEKLGRPAAYRYLKVFGSYGVKRLLESHKDCVFDFGGGGVTGEFPDEKAEMKAALAPFRHVIYLIPEKDKAASLKYLYQRLGINPPGWTLLEHMVNLTDHDELATRVVFVRDKTPAQICEEVAALLD